MKPEIICGVETIGPWGWSVICAKWYLFGYLPGSDNYAWNDSCLTLTGHDEPGEPVRVRVPRLEQPEYMTFRRIIYPDGNTKPVIVDAWPIESHGLSLYVWVDSRRVLRYIERLAQGGAV
jgi:hypothetical protein